MKPMDRSPGKISEHLSGLGTVTDRMVRERAREIALIKGRAPDQFTRDDWEDARRELVGLGSEVEEPESAEQPWGGPVGSQGREVETKSPPDEQECAQELVEEGLEEANHDQMTEGAKRSPAGQ